MPSAHDPASVKGRGRSILLPEQGNPFGAAIHAAQVAEATPDLSPEELATLFNITFVAPAHRAPVRPVVQRRPEIFDEADGRLFGAFAEVRMDDADEAPLPFEREMENALLAEALEPEALDLAVPTPADVGEALASGTLTELLAEDEADELLPFEHDAVVTEPVAFNLAPPAPAAGFETTVTERVAFGELAELIAEAEAEDSLPFEREAFVTAPATGAEPAPWDMAAPAKSLAAVLGLPADSLPFDFALEPQTEAETQSLEMLLGLEPVPPIPPVPAVEPVEAMAAIAPLEPISPAEPALAPPKLSWWQRFMQWVMEEDEPTKKKKQEKEQKKEHPPDN